MDSVGSPIYCIWKEADIMFHLCLLDGKIPKNGKKWQSWRGDLWSCLQGKRLKNWKCGCFKGIFPTICATCYSIKNSVGMWYILLEDSFRGWRWRNPQHCTEGNRSVTRFGSSKYCQVWIEMDFTLYLFGYSDLLMNLSFRLLDCIQSSEKLYLVFEFVDKDLKKYMDSLSEPLEMPLIKVKMHNMI